GFANNAIPISILISDFDVLKQEVKQNNLLQMNSQNQFEPTNPSFDYFETHHIALVSPLIKQLKGTKIEFELTNNLVFNTTSNQISKIEANFDNKGFINLSLNKKFTIDFSSLGKKEVTFKLTLENGSTFTNKVAIDLKPKAQPLDYAENISHRAPSEVS